jgi:hypothetical protein
MSKELQGLIEGTIVYPWSPGYDKDRKDFNDIYPAYPSMIVYVESISDIQWSLKTAQEQGLHTVIRSGGHSLAGYSVSNGMIIDMSRLNNITVDAASNMAMVEAGCIFEKVNEALEAEGFHLPGGGCPTVAVSGYMMGGGYGFTSRTFGMNCDNVLAVLVMLADGTIVLANEEINTDLFWAIRGGTGGNFGVLLSILYKIYPLGNIFGRQVQWPIDSQEQQENAAQAMHTIQERFIRHGQFPDMGIELALIEDQKHQVKKLTFCATWVGNKEDLEMALAPLLAVPGGTVTMDLYGKYSCVNGMLLSNVEQIPRDIKAYSRCAYFERPLEVKDYQNILNYYQRTAPNKYTIVAFECYGGVINKVAPDAMAFIHRNVMYDCFADAFFDAETNDQEKNKLWLEGFFNFLREYTNGHSYQNYPNRLQEDFRWAYWGDQYEKLVNIKAKYDPTNFFYYQQSIGYQPPTKENAES